MLGYAVWFTHRVVPWLKGAKCQQMSREQGAASWIHTQAEQDHVDADDDAVPVSLMRISMDDAGRAWTKHWKRDPYTAMPPKNCPMPPRTIITPIPRLTIRLRVTSRQRRGHAHSNKKVNAYKMSEKSMAGYAHDSVASMWRFGMSKRSVGYAGSNAIVSSRLRCCGNVVVANASLSHLNPGRRWSLDQLSSH